MIIGISSFLLTCMNLPWVRSLTSQNIGPLDICCNLLPIWLPDLQSLKKLKTMFIRLLAAKDLDVTWLQPIRCTACKLTLGIVGKQALKGINCHCCDLAATAQPWGQQSLLESCPRCRLWWKALRVCSWQGSFPTACAVEGTVPMTGYFDGGVWGAIIPRGLVWSLLTEAFQYFCRYQSLFLFKITRVVSVFCTESWWVYLLPRLLWSSMRFFI